MFRFGLPVETPDRRAQRMAPERSSPQTGRISCSNLLPQAWEPGQILFRSRNLDQALSEHGSGDFQEAGNVGAGHVVAGGTVLFSRLAAGIVDVFHDLL